MPGKRKHVPDHRRCPCGSPAEKCVCPSCRQASCPACDPRTPLTTFYRWLECSGCTEKRIRAAFDRVAIRGIYDDAVVANARAVVIKRTAQVLPRAKVDKWKPRTLSGYESMATQAQEWGEQIGIEVLGTADTLDTLVVAAYYIDRVDEGEGVAPSTVNKEMAVWTHWWDAFVQSFPDRAKDEHPVRNAFINDLKDRAKLWFQEAPVPKVGYTVAQMEEFFGDGTITGDWIYDHSRLAAGLMFFLLLRSVAAGHLKWHGNCAGPIASADSDVSWGSDAEFGDFMHARIDRDKTLRNQQSSHRYHPRDNGTRVNIHQYVADYIRHYRVPSGTFVLAAKRRDGSWGQSPFTNWSRVTDTICSQLKLRRELYGTQSCRRGCAEWLNRHGIDFEQVGLLGFWLSDVVRTYCGAQPTPHLKVWSHASEDRDGNRGGGRRHPRDEHKPKKACRR